MADLHVFTGDEVIATELPTLLNTNFNSIKSDFAGTAFPTANLLAGMTCYRTDQKKVYRLMSDLSTWKLESDLNYDGGLPIATQAEAEALADNTKIMTPLRTKQSITKQVFGGGSVVPTTSGGTGNANGIAPSADKLATARYINGVSFDGTANITNYVECTTAAATVAKTVTVTGFSLVKGASLRIKFTNGNTAASPTLNVNSTGAKSLMYWGYGLKGKTSEITAYSVYEVCYDGTYWRVMSELTMVGATSSADGARGVVPTPTAGKQNYFLRGDGTWQDVPSFESYWSAGEAVSVGDIRYPRGRENSGLFLECVSAGTTGTTQPNLDTSVLADFSDVGRIGAVRWIYNVAEKDDDEIFATGVAYSRATYSALWQYVQSKPALLITEAEWQAKYTATGGKFVPYYSSGDGSSTFRTPLLCAYATGVADNSKIGTFKEAGLPNITGGTGVHLAQSGTHGGEGAFYWGNHNGKVVGASGNNQTEGLMFDASRSNPIYGNSDTVTPDTMYGVWVIKAFGLIVNAENTDVKSVLTNIQTTNQKISNFETNYDFVVESWRDGTSWYRKYKSGWVEQGGYTGKQSGNVTKAISFFLPFKDTNYSLTFGVQAEQTNWFPSHNKMPLVRTQTINSQSFEAMFQSESVCGFYWRAEGMWA